MKKPHNNKVHTEVRISRYEKEGKEVLDDARLSLSGFFAPEDRTAVSAVGLFFFSFFKHLYWSIIALQWCVSFCFTTK